MSTVTKNLIRLLNTTSLDRNWLASELFPGHKHPRLALVRVLKGNSELTTVQLGKLSFMLNIPVEQLYQPVAWTSKSKESAIEFKSGDYSAVLDRVTFKTRIYHHKSLFHGEIEIPLNISLKNYLEILDKTINSNNI